MLALGLRAPRDFGEVVLPIPVPADGELLVRLLRATICGSDLPKYTNSTSAFSYPLPPGMPLHECVGEVSASTAPGLNVGTVVIAMPEGDRGLSEYFVARFERTFPLPEWAPAYDPAPLVQPLACVLHGIEALGDTRGKRVAVVGAGGIGCLFVAALRRAGAAEVLSIDPLPSRCRLAADLGATSIESCVGDVSGDLEAREVDICVEAVGHQEGTVNECLRMVRHGGQILAFGVPDASRYAIEYGTFFRKNVRLVAAVTPPWRPFFAKAIDAMQDPGFRGELSRLITRAVPLEQAAGAYEAAAAGGDNGKTLIRAAT